MTNTEYFHASDPSFRMHNKGGLVIPKEELYPWASHLLCSVRQQFSIERDGNSCMKQIMEKVQVDSTQSSLFHSSWNHLFSDNTDILNNIILRDRIHQKLLIRMVRARANVNFKVYKDRELSRHACKRAEGKILLLRTHLKGHFENGKIGQTFDVSNEDFKIRVLVRSMRFYSMKAAELKETITKLIFIPEPNNIHDCNAISVNYSSDCSQVGYVSQEQNIHLLKLLNVYKGSLSIISHKSENNYEFDMWVDVIISCKPEDREAIFLYLRSIHSKSTDELPFQCINKKRKL